MELHIFTQQASERARESINMNERIVHSSQLSSTWPSIEVTGQVTAPNGFLLLRTSLPSSCGSVSILRAARTHPCHRSQVTLAAGSVEAACRNSLEFSATGRRCSKALPPPVCRCGRGRYALLRRRRACLPVAAARARVTIGQCSLVTSSRRQRGAARLAARTGHCC